MMLFTQVTRCPHCQTSFRVSDEHLEAANGVVRCGSCLQVFKATDYLVNENQAPKPSEPVLEPTSELNAELNAESSTNTEALESTGTTSSIRFMPEDTPENNASAQVQNTQAPSTPASFSFTFADDSQDDVQDTDTLTDDIQTAVHSKPEPEQNEEPLAQKPQEFPDVDHFSDKKAAKHKAALASHLVDLSADDDDDEPDLDLDGELLFSDDGVVAIEPEATAIEPEAIVEENQTSTTDQQLGATQENSIFVDVELTADEITDVPGESLTEELIEELTEDSIAEHVIEEIDYSVAAPELEPETQPEVHSEVQSDQETPSSEIGPGPSSVNFSGDATPTTDDTFENFEFTTESEPALKHQDEPDNELGDIEFSFTGTDEDASDLNDSQASSDHINKQSDEDDFADLLDDAMAEADLDNNASLDDLLEKAEAKLESPTSSVSTPDLKPEPIPNSADDDIDDEDIRFHDDMDGVDHLAELLGEDTPPESKTDHFSANIVGLVSDDYNDIMSTVEKAEYDDNEHEDKWALELLGASEQKPPARYQDDIEGPDLDSIEEFENSGALSFSQIHEQNRSSSNFNNDTKQNSLSSSKAEVHKTNEEYVDDYVDEYSDDFVDDYIDDTLSDPVNTPVVPDPFDEEIDYSDRLSNSADEQGFASEFDNTPEGQAIASNIGQSREIEIPNMSMLDAHELDIAPSSSSNNFAWSLLALLLIVVAAAQVGWFRFETAARSETWRPMYEKICSVIGCQLPGIQNINLIRATNTVFNTHRSDPTGIIVDTLLTNTAAFPQPYPDIELEFRDLNGQIVAQRTFAPSDYLAGDVLPGDSMPTDIPVHIALEIVNPGPEAVSRQIFIRANQ